MTSSSSWQGPPKGLAKGPIPWGCTFREQQRLRVRHSWLGNVLVVGFIFYRFYFVLRWEKSLFVYQEEGGAGGKSTYLEEMVVISPWKRLWKVRWYYGSGREGCRNRGRVIGQLCAATHSILFLSLKPLGCHIDSPSGLMLLLINAILVNKILFG